MREPGGRSAAAGRGAPAGSEAGPARPAAGSPGGTSSADPRRSALRRLRAVAVGLLLAALAGLGLATAMGGQGAWAWVAAFCEAAAVGALADWFAVTALFRRPLGLPIPHTAIVPAGKARLADNLAAFVRTHFLAPQALLDRLAALDPAGRLAGWLADPVRARHWADAARGWALQALDLLDEDAVRAAIHGFLVQRLRDWDAARAGGDVLALLTRDGRHQRLLDSGLDMLAAYLARDEVRAQVSSLLARHARREWPRLTSLTDAVGSTDTLAGNLADRIARALVLELQEVLTRPDHPVRRDYEARVRAFVAGLSDDPEVRAQVNGIKDRLAGHPAMQDYASQLWREIHDALRRDLSREDSALAGHLAQAMSTLGGRLAQDPALRRALNEHMLAAAGRLADGLRDEATRHIAQTVKDWDDERLVQVLELNVGRDLQYIRLNGTLVGGLIGLALHALVLLLGPLLHGGG